MAEKQDIENKRFELTTRSYIKITTLASILVAAVTGTWWVFEKKVELIDSLENCKKDCQSSQADLQEVRTKLSKANEALKYLAKESPIPEKPERDSISIDPFEVSTEILRWRDAQQSDGTDYKIMLHSPGSGFARLINVKGKNQLEIHRAGWGLFFWKIGDVKGQQRWSDYAAFGVYPSTLLRVRATQRLRVGRTPTYDKWDDDQVDFEDELVELIAEYLGSKLHPLDADHLLDEAHPLGPEDRPKFHLRVEVEKKDFDWSKQDTENEDMNSNRDPTLLEAVQHNHVDIALANITKSTDRERKYLPLKFTEGYLTNHQLLVHRKGERYAKFPDGLRGKVVSAHANSMNLKAARAISKKYRFHVYDKAPSYADSLDRLEDGTVDFVMIDSVAYAERRSRVSGVFECYYGPSGPELDDILSEFYLSELEQSEEKFAIAVYDKHPRQANTSLLKLINEWLESKDGQDAIEKLKKDHFPGLEDPCRR